jgi:hypothetical protein
VVVDHVLADASVVGDLATGRRGGSPGSLTCQHAESR